MWYDKCEYGLLGYAVVVLKLPWSCRPYANRLHKVVNQLKQNKNKSVGNFHYLNQACPLRCDSSDFWNFLSMGYNISNQKKSSSTPWYKHTELLIRYVVKLHSIVFTTYEARKERMGPFSGHHQQNYHTSSVVVKNET